jgi:hypothetical protein
MILSPQRNFCFIHIPKTGGSSIEWAYGRSLLFGDIILDGSQSVMSHFYREELKLGRHASAEQISHHFGRVPFQMMLSFAVIREPVDRIISYFRWIHSFEHGGAIERSLKEVTKFEEFVSVSFEHLAPQYNFVCDTESDESLINFLVPFSHINAAWRILSERLMLGAELPHMNSSHKTIEVKVTDVIRSEIQKFYALDVALHERVIREFNFLTIDLAPEPK